MPNFPKYQTCNVCGKHVKRVKDGLIEQERFNAKYKCVCGNTIYLYVVGVNRS